MSLPDPGNRRHTIVAVIVAMPAGREQGPR